MSKRVLSNKRVSFFAGPEIAIDDWEAPSLADLQSLENLSGGINWDGFDFNLEASDQADDRVLTDAAGAQSRQYDQFGGAVSMVHPEPTDTSSIFRIAYDILSANRVLLAVAVRTVKSNAGGLVTGDEINLFRVETDAPAEGRGDVSHFTSVQLAGRDDVLVNYIVPSASPTATVLTPATALVGQAVGAVGFINADYEGRRVTIGAKWVSSNPAVVEVGPQGMWRAVGSGVALLTAQSAGGLVSTGKSITVT